MQGRTKAIAELYRARTNNAGEIEPVKLSSVQHNTIKSIESMNTNQLYVKLSNSRLHQIQYSSSTKGNTKQFTKK